MNAAPCDVLKAELVDQLNQEKDYDDKIKNQNLGMIRIKAFENNPIHKKLLQRLVAFNENYEAYHEKMKESDGMILSINQADRRN